MQRPKPDEIAFKWDSFEKIPSSIRTKGKDQAAKYIIHEVLSKDRWPMSYSEMAEESGWSRQHIRNVVSDYFSTGGETDSKETTVNAHGASMSIEIPEGVNTEDYLQGFIKGFIECRKQ